MDNKLTNQFYKNQLKPFSWKLTTWQIRVVWHECMTFDHYDDVIMDSIASQITSLTIVYSTVHSGADQRKHQSSASLAFVWEIHRWQVNFPHKWPVTRKMFPFNDVIMDSIEWLWWMKVLGQSEYTIKSWHISGTKPTKMVEFMFFNTLRPRQNGWHSADDIFKCILV